MSSFFIAIENRVNDILNWFQKKLLRLHINTNHKHTLLSIEKKLLGIASVTPPTEWIYYSYSIAWSGISTSIIINQPWLHVRNKTITTTSYPAFYAHRLSQRLIIFNKRLIGIVCSRYLKRRDPMESNQCWVFTILSRFSCILMKLIWHGL